MTCYPSENYGMPIFLKFSSCTINYSSQKPVFFVGKGMLDCLKSFLQVTKDSHWGTFTVKRFF